MTDKILKFYKGWKIFKELYQTVKILKQNRKWQRNGNGKLANSGGENKRKCKRM